jgi:sigma-B regulation protein RsbU (phosphoserine phosphatase)
MTLLYAEIDPTEKSISWIHAGHDPAMLYTPDTESFNELKGPGMAPGVDEA